MPIYEYQCEACGHRTEAIQRLAEKHLTECGECGGPIRRLISAPAVQFKGSGWYVTDYAGRKGKESAESASDSKPGAATEAGKAKAEKPASEASSKPSE